MNQPDFFWGYLPFWIVNYGLSLVAWACIALRAAGGPFAAYPWLGVLAALVAGTPLVRLGLRR